MTLDGLRPLPEVMDRHYCIPYHLCMGTPPGPGINNNTRASAPHPPTTAPLRSIGTVAHITSPHNRTSFFEIALRAMELAADPTSPAYTAANTSPSERSRLHGLFAGWPDAQGGHYLCVHHSFLPVDIYRQAPAGGRRWLASTLPAPVHANTHAIHGAGWLP